MASTDRYYSSKIYLIYVLLFTCAYSSTCLAADIQVEVKAVRIIYINYANEITEVTSNTSLGVEPTIERLGAPHARVNFSASLQKEYEHILKQYDFSRPTIIRRKNISGFEMILNVIINNLSEA
jgi:hypothetical protein